MTARHDPGGWKKMLRAALVVCGVVVPRADVAEDTAWRAAVRGLEAGQYGWAAGALEGFLEDYPNSTRRGLASMALLQARGEAALQEGRFDGAAVLFAQVRETQQESPWVADAVLGEATALFRTGDFAGAADLLRDREETWRGGGPGAVFGASMLLGEALLAQGRYGEAASVVEPLPAVAPGPVRAWEAAHLRARILTEGRRWKEALAATEELLERSRDLPVSPCRVRSLWARSDLLRRLNRTEEAYELLSLAPVSDWSPAERREWYLRRADLAILSRRPAAATEVLAAWEAAFPGDSASDLAVLTRGEVALRRRLVAPVRDGSGEPDRDWVALARTALEGFGQRFPDSPFRGLAALDLGWCHWIGGGEAGDAAALAADAAFRDAAERLPRSMEQAVARLKAGDCRFISGAYGEAIADYEKVGDDYAGVPGTSELAERALYQMVRAHVELKQLDDADRVMSRIIQRNPSGAFSEYGSLLLGHGWNRQGRTEAARMLFRFFQKFLPGSRHLPQVDLALAGTYEKEGDWRAAVGIYDQWVATWTNHPALPTAEYFRALATDRAGEAERAHALMTNFVARFPGDSNAPLALNWVADRDFARGDFDKAEQGYQLVFQGNGAAGNEVGHRARLMAARSAFLRRGIRDAREYATDLINLMLDDTNSSPDLMDQAWLLLGDAIIEDPDGADERPSEKWVRARTTFAKIPPEHRLGPRALGRVGDCYLQLAAQEPRYYTNAFQAYGAVVALEHADLETRSLAEIGQMVVLRKRAESAEPERAAELLERALVHGLNVWTETGRRPEEPPVDVLRLRAVEEAAVVLERLGRWDELAGLYRQLLREFPVLDGRFRRRLEQAEQRGRGGA